MIDGIGPGYRGTWDWQFRGLSQVPESAARGRDPSIVSITRGRLRAETRLLACHGWNESNRPNCDIGRGGSGVRYLI